MDLINKSAVSGGFCGFEHRRIRPKRIKKRQAQKRLSLLKNVWKRPLQLTESFKSIFDANGRAVGDQILLAGRTHLFKVPVLGEGGKGALHGSDFLKPAHFQEKVESACLLIAIQ